MPDSPLLRLRGQCPLPPNTLKPTELQDLLKKYHWAVFFTLDVPPEVIVRDKATIKERVAAYQHVYKIVNELESVAFYDGHYLAFGFAAGSCRHTFCGQQEGCLAMEGKNCRFSLKSRPSMEAVGIDVYKMAARPAGISIPSAAGQARRYAERHPGRHRHRPVKPPSPASLPAVPGVKAKDATGTDGV